MSTTFGGGPHGHAPRGRVISAFATLYVVWGSTYIFMRFAGETIPPVGVSGFRFFMAGAVLLALAAWRSGIVGVSAAWRPHVVVGILLTLGNVSITWSVQRIPSGVASLLVAMTPCWMVLLEWWRPGGQRPAWGVIAGLALGVLGTVVLVGPHSMGGAPIDPLGAGVVLAGTVLWAGGSIYARGVPRLGSGLQTSAVQLMTGGATVLVLGAIAGEYHGFHWSAVTRRSGFSLVYLILVGSVVGYSTYMYLLGVTSAALAATYAFVNPVVAVLLGALLAGETVSLRIFVAGAVIVGAVALITLYGRDRDGARRPLAPAPVREAP